MYSAAISVLPIPPCRTLSAPRGAAGRGEAGWRAAPQAPPTAGEQRIGRGISADRSAGKGRRAEDDSSCAPTAGRGWPGHLRRLPLALRLHGGLPEDKERRDVTAQRLHDVFQEAPARHPGVAEYVVHGRRADPAAADPGRDLAHRGAPGLQVQLIKSFEEFGDRPGRRGLRLIGVTGLPLPTSTACPSLSITVHNRSYPAPPGDRPPADAGPSTTPAPIQRRPPQSRLVYPPV